MGDGRRSRSPHVLPRGRSVRSAMGLCSDWGRRDCIRCRDPNLVTYTTPGKNVPCPGTSEWMARMPLAETRADIRESARCKAEVSTLTFRCGRPLLARMTFYAVVGTTMARKSDANRGTAEAATESVTAPISRKLSARRDAEQRGLLDPRLARLIEALARECARRDHSASTGRAETIKEENRCARRSTLDSRPTSRTIDR